MAIENSDLPTSYLNEIIKTGEEIIVRSNLKSSSDVYTWIREFERKSNTKWNLRNSRPSATKILCSYKFICHHSGFKKVPRSQVKIGISKNTNCPATITIKVKLDTKDVKKKDEYAKRGLLAVITICNSHNHSLETSETLRFLPSNDCQETFFQYFDNGMNIPQAIKFHEKDLKMQENFNIEMLANSRLNPTYRSVKYWYTNWRLINLGPRTGTGLIQNNSSYDPALGGKCPERNFFEPFLPTNREQNLSNIPSSTTEMSNIPSSTTEMSNIPSSITEMSNIHSLSTEDTSSNLDRPAAPHLSPPQRSGNEGLYNSFIAALDRCHQKFMSSDSGLIKITERLNKMSSVGQWESFLHSNPSVPLRMRDGAAIRVQPTSIARRAPKMTKGSKRLPSGRPPSGVNPSKKRKHSLSENINLGKPNAKLHRSDH